MKIPRDPLLYLGVGAGLGLGKTIFDSDEDDLITTGINVGVGATLGVLTHEAIDRLMRMSNYSPTQEEKEAIQARVVKQEAKSKTQERPKRKRRLDKSYRSLKEHLHYVDHPEMAKYRRMFRGAKAAGKVGLGAFALATLLDLNDQHEKELRKEAMLRQQEENLRKKMRKEILYSKLYSFVQNVPHVDARLVFDLFDERTGHYKMGNAKFQ